MQLNAERRVWLRFIRRLYEHKSMTHTNPTWLSELDAFGLIYIFLVLRASPTRFAKDTQQLQQVRHGGQTIASDVCAALGFATKFGQDREDILHSDRVVAIQVTRAVFKKATAIVHHGSRVEVQGLAVGAAFLPQVKDEGAKHLFLTEWKSKDRHPSIDADVDPKSALKRWHTLQIHAILVATNEAAGIARISIVVAHHFESCIGQGQDVEGVFQVHQVDGRERNAVQWSIRRKGQGGVDFKDVEWDQDVQHIVVRLPHNSGGKLLASFVFLHATTDQASLRLIATARRT